MKRLLNLILMLCAIAASCSSCVIRRVFTAEKGESSISPEAIMESCHPDGIIEDIFHDCSNPGPSKRRLLVYLPADYYRTDKSYPVVYLLHGARGNESSWIDRGNMIAIVDSLRRDGLMEESIIVLPNMNQYDTEEEGLNSTFKSPVNAFLDTNGAVEEAFVRDVVDFVDAHYRTIADKAHRAIAGLSLGSMQSIFISAHEPDTFDYVGLFSPIFRAPVKNSLFSFFYEKPAVRKLQKIQFDQEHCPKVYAMMIGRMDCYFFHSEMYDMYLTRHKFPHQYIVTSGGHNWNNWDQYLYMFLQMCFK